MCFPQQPHFRFVHKPECTQPDQQYQMLNTYRNAGQKIFKRPELPAPRSLPNQLNLEIVFQIGNKIKSQVNAIPVNRCLFKTFIDTGEFNTGATPPGFIHINPGTVETPKIINHSHHKVQRIMSLEIEALKALHRVGSRMGLGEGVSRKTLDLPPHLPGSLIGTAQGAAILKEAVDDPLKLALRTELPAHGPAQHIGIRQVQPRKMVAHLEHILLKNHHTVSLLELFLHHRMEIGKAFRVVKTVDILPHHPAPGNTRTDNRTGCHQRNIVVAMEFFQQATHRRALNIKAADRLANPELMLHLKIFLELLHPVNINLHLPVPLNDLNTVVDVADAALTQNIEFLKAYIFSHIHIPLGCLKPLRRKIKGRKTGYRLLRNQHTTCMNGSQVGKILHQRTYCKQLPVQLSTRCRCSRIIGQHIDLIFWQPVHLPQLTQDRLSLKGVHRPQECRVAVPIAFKNIFMNIVTVAPRKVDIKVGGRGPFGVEKPFKIEIQLDRIDVGDLQTIGYN